MHDEDSFLSAIRQTPADDTARLVFADWLNEQDDPTCQRKAEFIRLELRMAETPKKSLNRIRWLKQLQKLAEQINPSWLAVVSHPKLEACRVSFLFQCPMQWEKLASTDSPIVRFCTSCKQRVHHCATIEEARSHAHRGNCVAVSLALVRKPNDLEPEIESMGFLVAGMIEPPEMPPTSREIPGSSLYEPATPPAVVEWSPTPPPKESDNQRPKPRHRKKRQLRHRNIQRENWEEME